MKTDIYQILEYSKKGWYVFPISPKGKNPITKNGFKDATIDQVQIRKWWNKYPEANVAISTGKISGVCVLDVDQKTGGLFTLEGLDIPETPYVKTGGGGLHYYFKYNPQIKTCAGLLQGIDIRSDGGYVVTSPSMHQSGDLYVWCDEDLDLAEAPNFMIGKENKNVNPSIPEIIKSGQRNEVLFKFGCSMRHNGASSEVIYKALSEINNLNCKPSLSMSEVKLIVKSVMKYKENHEKLQMGCVKKKKKEKMGLAGICNLLEETESLKGIYKFNEFTKTIEYAIRPLWNLSATVNAKIEDIDFILLKGYISSKLDSEFSTTALREAVVYVSFNQYRHHPVKHYIEGVKWDNKPRIDTWLRDYCGVADNAYTRAVSSKMLIAAVARVYNPGCKFDNMVIFEGEQGLLKSTLINILGGEWYAEIPFRDTEKDLIDAIRNVWFAEVGELAGFDRRDVSSLKSFLSRSTDLVRLPYARESQYYPRHCIFIGTINPEGNNEYLRDTTGNRRFWPIKCGEKLDLESVKKNRDQFFAEAYVRFRRNEKIYLDNEEVIAIAKHEQELRESKDAWENIIRGRIEENCDKYEKNGITSSDICRFLYMAEKDLNRSIQTRFGIVMRKLGWKNNTHGVYFPGENYVEKI